ncbi:DUF559 domain-containing protein [Elusimicrobiota bacterium]
MSEKEIARTRYINSKGYRMIRFWDNDALKKTQEVLEAILIELGNPSPFPLPQGEGAKRISSV